jgi:hypothetical protein
VVSSIKNKKGVEKSSLIDFNASSAYPILGGRRESSHEEQPPFTAINCSLLISLLDASVVAKSWSVAPLSFVIINVSCKMIKNYHYFYRVKVIAR